MSIFVPKKSPFLHFDTAPTLISAILKPTHFSQYEKEKSERNGLLFNQSERATIQRAIWMLSLSLRRFFVELHYVNVLGTLSLFHLAIYE